MSIPNATKYLRVLSPKTLDGAELALDDDDRKQYEEQHFPLTARKALNDYNETLPRSLKMTILEVSSDAKPVSRGTAPVPDARSTEERIAALTRELESLRNGQPKAETPVTKVIEPVAKVNEPAGPSFEFDGSDDMGFGDDDASVKTKPKTKVK